MKQGEIDYLEKAGDGYKQGALNKPFSENQCAKNLVAMGLILSLLPPRPARILDLGCGSGWTSWFMAKNGYDVVGQDIAPDMIELARTNKDRFEASTASFILSDYESLDLSNQFDVALFYDSLHHAEDPEAAVTCAYRSLVEGGILITHEPGDGHSTNPASIAAMQKWGVTERDMSPRYIFELARKAGFRSHQRMLDPTSVFRSIYGVNIDEQTIEFGLRKKARALLGLVRRACDPGQGAICILKK